MLRTESYLLVGIIIAVEDRFDPITAEPRGRLVDVVTELGVVTMHVDPADASAEFVLRSPAALPVVATDCPEFGLEIHYAANMANVPQETRELVGA